MTRDDDANELDLPDNWVPLSKEERTNIEQQLKNEICNTHLLKGRQLRGVARNAGTDDYLFFETLANNRCFVVHLTWTKQVDPVWPWVTSFKDYADFLRNWKTA